MGSMMTKTLLEKSVTDTTRCTSNSVKNKVVILTDNSLACSSMAELTTVNRPVASSSLATPVWEISSAVERFVYTEDATGSIPVSPMSNTKHDP